MTAVNIVLWIVSMLSAFLAGRSFAMAKHHRWMRDSWRMMMDRAESHYRDPVKMASDLSDIFGRPF